MTMASAGTGDKAESDGGGGAGGESRNAAAAGSSMQARAPVEQVGPCPPETHAQPAAASAAPGQQAPASVSDLPIAHENYEELNEIGNGAYGTVYRARDLMNEGRVVALKKIRITLSDEGVPVNAVREIALLKQLERFEHPNIVKLLDICHGKIEREERLTLILVFEYMEQDLDHYLKQCPSPGLEPDRIKSLMHQILSGVDFLHSNRIIHRDMKPQNILVDRHGTVKIADFGLARIYDFNMRLTITVVTLWYRAPEVLLSNSYATAVDVWSCGCIFAELFRKRPLFEGRKEGDQLHKIFDVIGTPSERDWPRDVSLTRSNFRNHPGRPFKDVVPEITDEATDLLKKMLSFKPEERISAFQAKNHPYFRGVSKPKAIVTTSSNRSTPTQGALTPLANCSKVSPGNRAASQGVQPTAQLSNSESSILRTANDENNPNAGNSVTNNSNSSSSTATGLLLEPKAAERSTTAPVVSTPTSTTAVSGSSAGIQQGTGFSNPSFPLTESNAR
ncbi:unnamed protein product [Meganyctiphanes norvegica]|uniref:cyclin-dependent kinase n=1 Tax=Meganyctiphanes norvegica TaxID=48144 RepID=A0AAV2RP85_MEGNR